MSLKKFTEINDISKTNIQDEKNDKTKFVYNFELWNIYRYLMSDYFISILDAQLLLQKHWYNKNIKIDYYNLDYKKNKTSK